jgi:eukaryotic-like serine/threonine-protein kinase
MSDGPPKGVAPLLPERRRTDSATLVVPVPVAPPPPGPSSADSSPSVRPRSSTGLSTPPGVREVLVAGATTTRAMLAEVAKSPGERLDVEGRVAAGGMGAIDVAVDRALDRRLALKTLHPHLLPNDSAVKMFFREARLTALLDHPHIVPIYDIGVRDGENLYFAMKLVEGQSLAALIRTLPHGPLDVATLFEILEIVIKVCDALAFAHSRGVIHCDIKPSNVMVGEFGQVYLMDWGIARLASSEASPSSARTRGEGRTGESATDNTIIGTPGYMSPEQARGDRVLLDARSDVFLLGALLYEVLTRRPPYRGTDRGEILTAAALASFPPPRSVVGDGVVPPELERIVLRAMARAPEDRYASVVDLREELVRFMRGGEEYPKRIFPAGSVIVREGEAGDAAYIIVSGRCEIQKELPSGNESLQSIGPGDVFGEMAILSEGPRTATVVAVEDTTVLVVTAAILEQEMGALKPWMATLLKSLAARFRDVDTKHRAAR